MDVGFVAMALIENPRAFVRVSDGDDMAGQRVSTIDGELRLELSPLFLAVERLVAQILGALHRREGLGGPVALQVGLAVRQTGHLPTRVRLHIALALRLTLSECQHRRQHAESQQSRDRAETMVHFNPPYQVAVIVRDAAMIPQDSVVRNSQCTKCSYSTGRRPPRQSIQVPLRESVFCLAQDTKDQTAESYPAPPVIVVRGQALFRSAHSDRRLASG